MTDIEKLSSYLTSDEIEEMKADGKNAQAWMDIESTYAVMQKYLDANMMEEAANMMEIVNVRIDYYTNLVSTVTGRSINFNEASGRWYDTTSGVFVPDPYVNMYQSQEDIEAEIVELYT